MARTNAPRHS